MDKLPIEVLRLICGYHIVTEIKENPRRKQFLIHARRLNIMAMPNNGYQEVFDLDSLKGSHGIFGSDEDLRARDLIPDTFGSLGVFFNRHLSEPLIQTLRTWREPEYYNEKNWEPLIWLIGNMSRLTEVNYLLKNMFPKCLLEVIHKHHSTCQLNVLGRQWLQLQEPGLEGSTPNIVPELRDPFEMDLLRSTCLHALLINNNGYRLAKTQVAVENIFPLITMAPNLKYIDLMEGAVGEMNDITKYNQSLDEYISKSNISPQYLATPISLRHRGYAFDSLKEWAKSTDFSSLRAFEFPNSYFPLEILNQVSKFPKLEYLHLGLQSPIGMAQDQSFARDLSSLFASLNPLKYIRVCYPRDTTIIYEIFAHHGRTLQGFIIEPYMPPGLEA
uniref:F-box domain-containing protein n=2 Tax=Talaromyces marneffei TaxID=37727 RepID=A0A093XPK8_TALMA